MNACTKTSVAIIGVGNMGGGMARNLLGRGYSVHVIDIDATKTRNLQAMRASVHETARTIPLDCTFIIIAVVDAAQMQDVLFGNDGLVHAEKSEAVRTVMLCPTVAPCDVESAAVQLLMYRIQVIDAPMSGGPLRAQDGSMSLMLACNQVVYDEHQTLLADLSQHVFHISQRVGDGARMKLCNNLLAGIHLAGAAQVLALAEKMELDVQLAHHVMQSSSAQSWIAGDRIPRALAGDLQPQAHLSLLTKDTRLAMEMLAGAGLSTELGQAAAQAFAQAYSDSPADADDSTMLAYFRQSY